MAIKEFKISGSQTSKIMGVRGLGETGENYVKEWLTGQMVGYRKEFSNKYTEKGLACENTAIELVCERYDLGFLSKNTERRENEFCEGECDVEMKTALRDIKCSWDIFTFPWFDKIVKNVTYIWQAQTYMLLWDKETYFLDYCLVDAEEHMIDKEYWRKHHALYIEGDEVDEKLYDEVRSKMIFSHLPIERRVKTFEIKRDNDWIAKIEPRVKECRNLILTLK